MIFSVSTMVLDLPACLPDNIKINSSPTESTKIYCLQLGIYTELTVIKQKKNIIMNKPPS